MELNTNTISTPHNHDVLCGRGGSIFRHAGNYAFRALIYQNKARYARSNKFEKIKVAKDIVNTIKLQIPSGRFIRHDEQKNVWIEIEDKAAIDKASQALREKSDRRKSTDLINSDELITDTSSISSTLKIPSSTVGTHPTFQVLREKPNASIASNDEAGKVKQTILPKSVISNSNQTTSFNDAQCASLVESIDINNISSSKTQTVEDEEINNLIYETFCMQRKINDSNQDISTLSTTDSDNDTISQNCKIIPIKEVVDTVEAMLQKSLKRFYVSGELISVNKKSKHCIRSRATAA